MTYIDAFGHSFQPEDLDAHLTTNFSEVAFKEILSRDSILVAVDDKKSLALFNSDKQKVMKRFTCYTQNKSS